VGIDIHNNTIKDEMPLFLFDFAKLEDLILYDNDFSGRIPPEIGNATSLGEIHCFTPFSVFRTLHRQVLHL